jgi:uncharacterized protein (DUF433 family)
MWRPSGPDPQINFGRPTVAARGIRVSDLLTRLGAGEPERDVASDYDLPLRQLRALVRAA